jgi:hypothetical protein
MEAPHAHPRAVPANRKRAQALPHGKDQDGNPIQSGRAPRWTRRPRPATAPLAAPGGLFLDRVSTAEAAQDALDANRSPVVQASAPVEPLIRVVRDAQARQRPGGPNGHVPGSRAIQTRTAWPAEPA